MDGTSVSGKICTRCGTFKPLDEFHFIHKGGTARRPICKACGCAARRAWGAKNPKKARAQWDRKNARRREKRAAAATPMPETRPGHKVCRSCRQEKPLSSYWKLKGSPDDLQPYCIDCCKERNRRWRQSHPEVVRESSRRNKKSLYGITQEGIDALAAAQGGCCAICRRSFGTDYRNRPCVDHDHFSNAVRGILCHGCNMAIGILGDDPATLESAAAYLRRHRDSLNDGPGRHSQ